MTIPSSPTADALDAWSQGYDAFIAQRSLHQAPYSRETQPRLREAWMEGWRDARANIQRKYATDIGDETR